MAGFGKVFLQESLAPLERSSERFRGNLLGDGVRMLSMAELRTGLERGISRAAREASSGVVTARALVPFEELEEIASRIDRNQAAALASVRRDGMSIAPFGLSVIADSPAVHLRSLARRFARDRHIATSLGKLAVDVADWHQLLHETAWRLDADPSLRESRRRARTLRLALAAAAAAVLAAALSTFAWVEHQRAERQRRSEAAAAAERRLAAEVNSRIDAVLGSPDPCEPAGILEADLPLASASQHERLARRKADCSAQASERAHQAFCRSIAPRLERGESFAPGGQLDAAAASLLTRIGQRALLPADLTIEPAALPCADLLEEAGIRDALAAASQGSPRAWMRLPGVSPFVASTVIERDAVPREARSTIAFQVEKAATTALQKPSVRNIEKAKALCALKSGLGLKLAHSCRTIRRLK